MDSERIRKITSDFMRKYNPDYHVNPAHNTPPTPLRDQGTNGSISYGGGQTPASAPPRSAPAAETFDSRARPGRGERKSEVGLSTKVFLQPPKAKNDFSGLSFQKAQEKLIEDMHTVQDEE
jgi:hypothetical protein